MCVCPGPGLHSGCCCNYREVINSDWPRRRQFSRPSHRNLTILYVALPAFAAAVQLHCRAPSAKQQSIDISCPSSRALSNKPAARRWTGRWMEQTDGRTDGRTLDRYIDPAACELCQ